MLIFSCNAFAIDFDGKFIQGHFIVGKTDPGSKIWIDKRNVKVTNDGYFAFGIGRDRKYDIIITKVLNAKKEKIVKKVKKENTRFKKLMVCLKKKVTPPKEFLRKN